MLWLVRIVSRHILVCSAQACSFITARAQLKEDSWLKQSKLTAKQHQWMFDAGKAAIALHKPLTCLRHLLHTVHLANPSVPATGSLHLSAKAASTQVIKSQAMPGRAHQPAD